MVMAQIFRLHRASLLPLWVLLFTTWGCTYPEAIQIDAPITQALEKSQTLSFEDRDAVVEHQLYRNVLQRVVQEPEGCLCRTCMGEKSEVELAAYLKQLQHVDLRELSRREQLSTLINAHNAFALYQLLLTMKELGPHSRALMKNFRIRISRQLLEVGETKLTLKELRNGVLRPYFRDPRIHFVLSDTTSSFAPFRNYPLSGHALKLQLETAVRQLLQDPRHLEVRSYDKLGLGEVLWRARKDIVDVRNNPHAESLKEWILRYGDDQLTHHMDVRRSGGLGVLSTARVLLFCR